MLEEGRIPVILTGTAVGVISITGYTQIFLAVLIGYFIDSYEGVKGYNYVYDFSGLFLYWCICSI